MATEDELNALKLSDLKDKARDRGLKVSGSKGELVARLLEDFQKGSGEKEEEKKDTPKEKDGEKAREKAESDRGEKQPAEGDGAASDKEASEKEDAGKGKSDDKKSPEKEVDGAEADYERDASPPKQAEASSKRSKSQEPYDPEKASPEVERKRERSRGKSPKDGEARLKAKESKLAKGNRLFAFATGSQQIKSGLSDTGQTRFLTKTQREALEADAQKKKEEMVDSAPQVPPRQQRTSFRDRPLESGKGKGRDRRLPFGVAMTDGKGNPKGKGKYGSRPPMGRPSDRRGDRRSRDRKRRSRSRDRKRSRDRDRRSRDKDGRRARSSKPKTDSKGDRDRRSRDRDGKSRGADKGDRDRERRSRDRDRRSRDKDTRSKGAAESKQQSRRDGRRDASRSRSPRRSAKDSQQESAKSRAADPPAKAKATPGYVWKDDESDYSEEESIPKAKPRDSQTKGQAARAPAPKEPQRSRSPQKPRVQPPAQQKVANSGAKASKPAADDSASYSESESVPPKKDPPRAAPRDERTKTKASADPIDSEKLKRIRQAKEDASPPRRKAVSRSRSPPPTKGPAPRSKAVAKKPVAAAGKKSAAKRSGSAESDSYSSYTDYSEEPPAKDAKSKAPKA